MTRFLNRFGNHGANCRRFLNQLFNQRFLNHPGRGGLGPELVTNGSFDSSDWWAFNAQWTHDAVNGKASYDATANNSLNQSNSAPAGKTVKFSITISDCASTMQCYVRAFPTSTYYLSLGYRGNGTYESTVSVPSNATYIEIRAYTGGNSGKIDNVSVKEIL